MKLMTRVGFIILRKCVLSLLQLLGVYEWSLMGNASSEDAKNYIKHTKVFAKLGTKMFDKFLNGYIREIPFLYKNFSTKFKNFY
jgi:hypothetical protein